MLTWVSRKVSERRPWVICLNPLLARGRKTWTQLSRYKYMYNVVMISEHISNKLSVGVCVHGMCPTCLSYLMPSCIAMPFLLVLSLLSCLGGLVGRAPAY